jgi:hypothetical protein
MYALKLWDFTGATAVALLGDASVRSWSTRINGPGRLAFTLPAGSLSVGKLLKYRQVTLDRRASDGTDETVWLGYLESHRRTGDVYTVLCAGMLSLFRKRLTANDETFTGQGSTEAFGLLTDANLVDATGITAGDGGVTTTKSLTAQGRKDVLGMWELLAQAHAAEFEITTGREFRFVPSLGSDKSGTVTLRFRRDGEPGNTVEGFEEGEDGEPMANRIIATTSAYSGAGNPFTYDDTASQLVYPVLEETKAFNEAQNAATLESLATAYGEQLANPVTDNQVVPLMEEKGFDVLSGERVLAGLEYGDVVPGDLVTCDIVTESGEIREARRVAEVLVDADDQGNETVRYTLTKAGIFVTSNYLSGDVAGDLTRRIAAVERLL